MRRRLFRLSGLAALLLLVPAASSVAHKGVLKLSVHKVQVEPGVAIEAVVNGNGGQVWAIGQRPGDLVAWRLDPAGRPIASYDLAPTAGQHIWRLQATAGPDGSLWVLSLALPESSLGGLSEATRTLSHVSIGGATSSVQLTELGASIQDTPTGLAVSPDGHVWFSTSAFAGRGAVNRIDPGTGAGTSFPVNIGKLVGDVVASSDGGVWLDPSHPSPKLVDVGPAGNIARVVPLPGKAQITGQMAAGSDGSIWMGARGYLAKLRGASLKTYRLPFGGAETAVSLVVAAHGGPWFITLDYLLGELMPTGRVLQAYLPLRVAQSGGPALATGNGANLWVVGNTGALYSVTPSAHPH